MSDTDDTNRALTALRERAGQLHADITEKQHEMDMVTAQLVELMSAIEIVERNGRKKPGPKVGGTRLTTAELASVAADAFMSNEP